MTRVRPGLDGTLILGLAYAPAYALGGVAVGLALSTVAPLGVVNACMAFGLAACAYRLTRVSVRADDDRVVITNLFRTAVVARADIGHLTAVTTGPGTPIPALGLVVVRPDGRRALVKMQATARIRRRNRRRLHEHLRGLAPDDPSGVEEYTEER